MKRAGIYLFYDADGIVDGYVDYFLKGLKTVVDYLVVVVNGKLTPEGRKKFAVLADDFFVRENVGFDAWGYKAGIEYIGWDQLKEYDELVITNHTIYGPIFPFQEIFDRMEEDDCDFWGMSTSYEDRNMKSTFGVPLKWGYRPESILSNFSVFKRSVLHSYEYRHHWDTLAPIKSYFESGVYHELGICKTLTDAGFVFSAADEKAFRNKCPSPTVYGAYEMLTRFRIPVIRRKAFYDSNGLLEYCTDQPREIIKFLEEHTDYPVELIWENLLRTTNQYDLKNWFNWNTILPLDYVRHEPAPQKVAVIFHTYYTDIMEKYLHNIMSFPRGTDFYFTSDTQEKLEALKELLAPCMEQYRMEFRMVENRGRDVSALLVGCRDVVLEGGYDLICFMHDKKGIGVHTNYSFVGDQFSDCCFENIAPTKAYVSNVLSLFEQQPCLGIAVPPPPRNANYYKVIGGGWTNNFRNTKDLLKKLEISVPMDEKKPPIAPYGTVFWFRPEALYPLFAQTWVYEDFDSEPMKSDGSVCNSIERGYSLIAQSQGYYPNIIMNNVYAEQEVTRMTEIAHAYVELTLKTVGPKPILKTAANELEKFLAAKKASPAKPVAPAKAVAPAITPEKKVPSAKPITPTPAPVHRGPIKTLIREICPIGIWQLLRRVKCAVTGEVYVELAATDGLLKSVVKACTPHFVWELMRKAKYKKNGWVFIPDD